MDLDALDAIFSESVVGHVFVVLVRGDDVRERRVSYVLSLASSLPELASLPLCE